MAPPRILKDKHVKLKLAAALGNAAATSGRINDGGTGVPPVPAGGDARRSTDPQQESRSEVAILTTQRCHPDAAEIRRADRREAVGQHKIGAQIDELETERSLATDHRPLTTGNNHEAGTENRRLRTDAGHPPATSAPWRRNITFDALAWHMAERLETAKLLAGDTLDIAFSIGHNDHPEYGGLELSLRDFHAEKRL
jgi:hypothetical protein